MDKYFAYKILPELELVVEYYGGKVTVDDIIQLKIKETEESTYNPNYSFIVFMQDYEMDDLSSSLIEESLKKYLKFCSSQEKVLGKRKTALITTTPNQVAIGTLYRGDTSDWPIDFEIFSTLEATIEWLKLSNDCYELISTMLKKFRNERA